MKKVFLFLTTFIFLSSSVYADHGKHNVVLDANQVKIQVNGVVCSFCAFGAQKNLSKLKFLDRSEFKKGVLVDIKNQQITLAIAEDKYVNWIEVYDSIKKGGYEPVMFYMPIEGRIMKNKSGLFIQDEKSKLNFVVDDTTLRSSGEVQGVVHFDADLIKSLDNESTIQASIEKLQYK